MEPARVAVELVPEKLPVALAYWRVQPLSEMEELPGL